VHGGEFSGLRVATEAELRKTRLSEAALSVRAGLSLGQDTSMDAV